MLSNFNRYVLSLKELTHKLSQIHNGLLDQLCHFRYKLLKKVLLNILDRKRLVSFKTKNRKLATLILKQDASYKLSTFSTHLINLSSIELTSSEVN